MKKYFDYNASTPIDKRVLNAYNYASSFFANPNSSHIFGEASANLINKAKEDIAKNIYCEPDEIIFTSGATESNNLAIQGIIKFLYNSLGKKKIHVICSSIEHDCVTETLTLLEEYIEVTFIDPNKYGMITPENIFSAVNENTKLIICMHVNHELGSITDIESIGNECKKRGIHFHVDAAQSIGKLNLNLVKIYVSTLSASGHKIYGPKGIGFLYCRRKSKRVSLIPLFEGGRQQRFRSGTMPTELCHSMSVALNICCLEMKQEAERLYKMQNKFIFNILSNLDKVNINGPLGSDRIYTNMNFSFYGVEGESVIMSLSDYAISTGSACRSDDLEPSKIIKSIVGDDLAHSSIRISIGRFSKEEDVEEFCNKLINVIKILRDRSPMFN